MDGEKYLNFLPNNLMSRCILRNWKLSWRKVTVSFRKFSPASSLLLKHNWKRLFWWRQISNLGKRRRCFLCSFYLLNGGTRLELFNKWFVLLVPSLCNQENLHWHCLFRRLVFFHLTLLTNPLPSFTAHQHVLFSHHMDCLYCVACLVSLWTVSYGRGCQFADGVILGCTLSLLAFFSKK